MRSTHPSRLRICREVSEFNPEVRWLLSDETIEEIRNVYRARRAVAEAERRAQARQSALQAMLRVFRESIQKYRGGSQ